MALHYVQKQISEVNATDSRVSIIGNVAAVGENSFILDDGTGKIEVISDIQIEKNKLVRVFCSIIEEKLKADIIQDMEGFDIDLFKKVKELYNSSGVWVFSAKLSDPKLFVNAVSTIGELIDEGIFNLTNDGISFIAADRAMVSVVDFKMVASAFDEYKIDSEQKIGLNITNLLSVLKRVEADDKMTLNLLDSKLEIKLEGKSKRRFVVPLLDISQEEIPPISQLEFPAKVEVKPHILESGIEDADIISDAVLFEMLNDKFVMRAEGDVSKAELELERGNESLFNLEANSEVKSRYPIDYLKKMVKAAKIADSVTIRLGQDYPMKLEFKAGDKASISFILAPRVSESD